VSATQGRDAAEAVLRGDLDSIVGGLGAELPRLAGRRVLITGGAGFLGYELVQALLHRNDDAPADDRVLLEVWDNYARGLPSWLAALDGRPDLAIRRHDVVAPLPADLPRFDYVVHAAGIASPTYYRLHPLETIDANVVGLRRLLDHARERTEAGDPLEGFLFFSSSEIYGDPTPDAIPTPETYRGNVSSTGPRACYDESKRFGETLCVTFASQFGVPVAMARPFNNYGPGLKLSDRRVIPDFARDVLQGRDIVLLSSGSPTRTFCYVADAVAGYLKILTRGAPGEAYNIGIDGPEIGMAELAELVAATAAELFGYEGRVIRAESTDELYLVDNPERRCPSIEKARSDLGFDPTVTLEEGIRRALVWYTDPAAVGDAA
jgi:nucleoside-diphosphate-sugar epimerase